MAILPNGSYFQVDTAGGLQPMIFHVPTKNRTNLLYTEFLKWKNVINLHELWLSHSLKYSASYHFLLYYYMIIF